MLFNLSVSKNDCQNDELDNESKYESYFGKTVEMSGKISSKYSVRVDGVFNGTIEFEADAIIGENGDVKADIIANNAAVAGKVEGNIVAKDTLNLYATSVIIGDVKCVKLTVEPGAVLRGTVSGNQVL